jgi:hypothetical protein
MPASRGTITESLAMSPEEFLIHKNIGLARTLPLPDAVQLLRGLLVLCGDSDGTKELRFIYTNLSESDRQLSLFETGQLKFAFEPKPPTNGPTSLQPL